MFDVAHAVDTIVEDDPDDPTSTPLSQPSTGRTPSTETVMHVLVNGERHRRMLDTDETSCSEPFRVMTTPTRREQLTHTDGRLCRLCFTPFEIARATRNDELARQREEREAEAERRKFEEFFTSLRKKTPSQGEP